MEAVRWGLPVITSDAGALPESVPASARVMVPASDVPALRGALIRLIDDADHRAALAEGARAAAEDLADPGPRCGPSSPTLPGGWHEFLPRLAGAACAL